MPQKGHHDIYIMKVGNEYRVRPAVWSTDGQKATGKQHAEMKIRNLTAETVTVVLPNILFSGEPRSFLLEPAGTPPPAPLQPGADPPDIRTVKLASRASGAAGGAYPFSVLMMTSTGVVQAVGESEPILIIDPPA